MEATKFDKKNEVCAHTRTYSVEYIYTLKVYTVEWVIWLAKLHDFCTFKNLKHVHNTSNLFHFTFNYLRMLFDFQILVKNTNQHHYHCWFINQRGHLPHLPLKLQNTIYAFTLDFFKWFGHQTLRSISKPCLDLYNP